MAGRFAVSIQDLNNHKDSTGAHEATSISTNFITFDGYSYNNVGDSLNGLSDLVGRNQSPFADTVTPGKIQLTTDLGGTYNAPQVTGLLGRPLVEGIVGINYTWLYTGATWTPGPVPVTGDLGYVSNVMRVNSIASQGGVGNVNIGKNLNYTGSYALNISHSDETAASLVNDINMYVTGRGITNAANNSPAGSVIIDPGANFFYNAKGAIRLNYNSIQLLSINNTNRVNFLGGTGTVGDATSLTTIGTGVNVIGKTSTQPSGVSGFGSILYSDSTGRLKYRNDTSNVNYWVGNPENPEIWRDATTNTSGSVYRERFVATSAINTVTDIKTYAISDTTIFSNSGHRMIIVKLTVTSIAASTGADSKASELIAYFKVVGATLSQVGVTEPMFAFGSNIIDPTITFTGSNIRITSSAHASQQCKAHYKVEIMQY